MDKLAELKAYYNEIDAIMSRYDYKEHLYRYFEEKSNMDNYRELSIVKYSLGLVKYSSLKIPKAVTCPFCLVNKWCDDCSINLGFCSRIIGGYNPASMEAYNRIIVDFICYLLDCLGVSAIDKDLWLGHYCGIDLSIE